MDSVWNIVIDDSSFLFTYEPYSACSVSSNRFVSFTIENAKVTVLLSAGKRRGIRMGRAMGVTIALPVMDPLYFSHSMVLLSNNQVLTYLLHLIGTGIEIIGHSNALYDVQFDNEPAETGLTAPATGMLYTRHNVDMNDHNFTLISRATSQSTVLTFDKAVVFNSGRGRYVHFDILTSAHKTPALHH